MCDLEGIGDPSIFNIIHTARRTPHVESGRRITLAELLKLQESGQFPDESVKIEGAQIHSVDTQTY